MLILLEQLFTQSQKLQSQSVRTTQEEKPVLYLEHMSKDTLDVAKSHLDWMNFKGSFQDIDDNPFAFKNIKAISSLDELKYELDNKPRVIITSSASFELGFGRKYLKDFVKEDTNMVIFTEQEALDAKCFGRKLLNGDKIISDNSFERVKTHHEDIRGLEGRHQRLPDLDIVQDPRAQAHDADPRQINRGQGLGNDMAFKNEKQNAAIEENVQ